MSVKITPRDLAGTINAPPSKSATHRYLITSALAKGVSVLENPLQSEDTAATRGGLSKLGANIVEEGDHWRITGGTLTPPDAVIDCKESGTTMRLLIGLCSLLDKPCFLSGTPSLLKRPNEALLQALEHLGASTKGSDGYSPITIKGPLKGGETEIRGDISSQYISSIILAAPYAEKPVTLRLSTRLESKPYVEMTIDTMKTAGIKPQYSENLEEIHVPTGCYKPVRTRIEGDWSSAAYLLAAGVIAGKVHVDNLDVGSCQADKEIIRILDEMGAYIKITGKRVTTEKSDLTAITTDVSDCPDLFPIVACLCAVAEGESTLTGLGRLRIKESDRLSAMIDGLRRMGVWVMGGDEAVTVKGGTPNGAVIDTYNDHRIAMSFAVLAQAAVGETKIMNPECVSKSYPGFWEDLRGIGAEIR